MQIRFRQELAVVTITWVAFGLAATPSSGQPPPSALVNQGSQETLEAARTASPHTPESTYAYFQEDAEDFIAKAIQLVWDPARPHPEPPRMPWGDPNLQGYWSYAAYTPLERADALAGKPLYSPQ